MSSKQTIGLFEREGPSARQDEELDLLFAVALRKPAGGKLGFAGMPVTVCGRSSIRIVSLKPGGLFDAYNRTCEPRRVICPGDHIMGIGDAAVDADRMMEQLAEADEVSVLILRSAPTSGLPGAPGCKGSTAVEPNSDVDVGSTAAGSTRQTGQSLTLDTLGSLGLESESRLALEGLGSTAAGSTRQTGQSLTLDTLGSLGLESESRLALEGLEALESRTTIMLRNLPLAMSREALAELLHAEGFAGLYDFIYLPRHFGTMMTFGCAFVNLVTPEAAKACLTTFDGYSWHATHGKACAASWAETEQGVEANIRRYQNSPVMHRNVPDECKPAVFRDGLRVPFPAPTVSLKAPRLSKRSPLPPPIRPPKAAALPKPAFVQDEGLM